MDWRYSAPVAFKPASMSSSKFFKTKLLTVVLRPIRVDGFKVNKDALGFSGPLVLVTVMYFALVAEDEEDFSLN